jgi:hypothetical protein
MKRKKKRLVRILPRVRLNLLKIKRLRKFKLSGSPKKILPKSFQNTANPPSQPGDDRMVLMARDPWWLFAYWEVSAERQKEILKRIRQERLLPDKTVLRVYELYESGRVRRNFDIEIAVVADHWYLETGLPDRRWVAELGVKTRDGRFFRWVRSNEARTPRFGPAEVLDKAWFFPEKIYQKIFKTAGGLDGFQKSSPMPS